jgi:hypothetical protein
MREGSNLRLFIKGFEANLPQFIKSWDKKFLVVGIGKRKKSSKGCYELKRD